MFEIVATIVIAPMNGAVKSPINIVESILNDKILIMRIDIGTNKIIKKISQLMNKINMLLLEKKSEILGEC